MDDTHSDVRPKRRYEPLLKLASGGMATVHLGYLRSASGFQQIVALKRPHLHLLEDPVFRQRLLAEAEIACRVQHANVVDVRDLDANEESIDIIMDYVEGTSLATLLKAIERAQERRPLAEIVRILLDTCAGLHAVHESVDEAGAPLGVVHRDVSPQNILVGVDGVARITDFGIAKCARAADSPSTLRGTLKGKAGYMSPEYVLGHKIDRRADIFGLGVVLWEALQGRALFHTSNDAETLMKIVQDPVPSLSGLPEPLVRALQPVADRALARDREERFATAAEFGRELEAAALACSLVASSQEVAVLVQRVYGRELTIRRATVRNLIASLSASQTVAAEHSAGADTAQERASTSRLTRNQVLFIGLVPLVLLCLALVALWAGYR